MAQIAKSIAIKLNHDLEKSGESYRIEPDIVEFAGLAHDLGHPPFGHFGEEVLDELMVDNGGFEGNAQTLRILTKIEKRQLIEDSDFGIDGEGDDKRAGLNLTARTLASILKYDNEIPLEKSQRNKDGVIKGYYLTESDIVKEIKKNISGDPQLKKFKTVECQIMDIADDIAYSTYDLEDSFKAGFIKPIDMICADDKLLEVISGKVEERLEETGINANLSADEVRKRMHKIFFDEFEMPLDIKSGLKVSKDLINDLYYLFLQYAHERSNQIAKNGYDRTSLTSKLVGSAIRKVSVQINKRNPELSQVKIEKDKLIDVEILKNFVFQSQILSPKIQIFKKRSKEIIETIFNSLVNESDGNMLLPDDFRIIHDKLRRKSDKERAMCDFIAGMTDKYAIEFYGRLKSINPQSIFKPMS